MKSVLKNDPGKIGKSDVAAIFVHEEKVSSLIKDKKLNGYEFIAGADITHFKGKGSELYFIKLDNRPGVILCGLGSEKKCNDESFRNAASAVVKFAISKKMKRLSVIVPEINGKSIDQSLKIISEGALLSNYTFIKYKTDKEIETPLDQIDFYINGSDSEVKKSASTLKINDIIVANTMLCRDLVNDTTDAVNPVSFAEIALKTSAIPGLKCTVFEKREIEKLKMGLLLAVNRGSLVPPRVVVLEYKGDPGSKKLFGLVGKGITFDSGGMDLKPPASMETMRCDMAGAATVLYVMRTIAELKLKRNVTAIIPLTENMLSNGAFRPGDVFTGYSGKTVEIGNTDAEGRLILADALAYMEKEIKPDVIVDLATLTGSCVVTFGETVAGYLSTDEKLSSAIESSSAETGEKIWRLPLFEDYDDRMKSDIADLNNMSSEKNAGAICGAVFLRNFVEKTPWAHIDIAGTAWYSKARGYRPKNATGFGLRLIVDVVFGWK